MSNTNSTINEVDNVPKPTSSSRKINILDPKEGFQYIQQLSGNQNLLSSMANCISIKYKSHTNVLPAELEKLIDKTKDLAQRELLTHVQDLKDEETTFQELYDENDGLHNSYFVFACHKNGTYDIINVTAIQVNPVTPKSYWPGIIGAAIGGTTGAVIGTTIGAATTTVVGAAGGGMALGAAGAEYGSNLLTKFNDKIRNYMYGPNMIKPPRELLYWFTLETLQQEKAITISEDGVSFKQTINK